MENKVPMPWSASQAVFIGCGELVMHTMMRFIKCSKGATAIEYGLICILVVTAIVAGLTNFGNSTEDVYKVVTDNVVQ